jgi:hypothetical protein
LLGTPLRKGEPVPFRSLKPALYLVGMLYFVSAIAAWIGGDWARFGSVEEAVAMVGAVFFMALGAASARRSAGG